MESTIEYRTPGPTTNRTARVFKAYALYGAVWFGGMMAMGAMLFIWVPRCREVFKDFKTSLPIITELVLSFADFLAHTPLGLILFVAMLFCVPAPPAILTAWPEDPKARRRVSRLLLLLLLLFILGAMVLIAISMGLPLIKLQQSVSGASE